jgi:hypothetical protein
VVVEGRLRCHGRHVAKWIEIDFDSPQIGNQERMLPAKLP